MDETINKNDNEVTLFRTVSKMSPEKPRIHEKEGFVMVWSTTQGHKVPDLSLLSQYWDAVMTRNYRNHNLTDMVMILKNQINTQCKWYCVEQNTITSYGIWFEKSN